MIGWCIVRHNETLREDLAGFGLEFKDIYDERMRWFPSP